MTAPVHLQPIKYAVVRYASETDNAGKKNVGTWPQVMSMLEQRAIRPQKSGKAFAPVAMQPGATRGKDNVLSISMAIADIDTEGSKDKTTGQLQTVTKRAPALSELRPSIERYVWAAHSSHWHEPQRLGGVIKYRVVFPLARPCTPEEWPVVWAGLNVLLDGHCDRQCKDPARLYYEPSCPQASVDDAFFESNEGELLDPDFLIGLARGSTSNQVAIFEGNNLATTNQKQPPPESLEDIERVKTMLGTIPANGDREQWRNVVWAIASTGWGCAESLARQWSQSAPDKFVEEEFSKVWSSFKPHDGIGYGTLVHHAKQAGWVAAQTLTDIEIAKRDTSGDILNGQVLARTFKDNLLFVHETGDVLLFDHAAGWVHAPTGEADRAGKTVVSLLRAYAAEQWKEAPDDAKNKRLMAHVERSSTAPKIDAMIKMAKSEPGMTVRLSELDADPMLLGVSNGVLDLRKRQLLAPAPGLRVTKRCPVPFDPEATAPNFEAFIQRITRGKPALAAFLQRLAGYTLTGEVNEQCFAFLYGLGRNGKTTFAELLFWLLGDYAVILPTATLTLAKRDPGAATPDLMLLKGRRLALASELEENVRFAEAAIKAMTGGDTLQARNPYGLFVSWTPTHKLMVVGNHRPVISGGDHGIWRRVKLIPFAETITDSECDPHLADKLRDEGAGVLNWALDGLRDWQRQRLNPPAEVKAAGAAYQTAMDTLGQWMDEHVDTAPGVTTPTADLYRAYVTWARQSGFNHPMSRPTFGRRLAERGIPLVKAGSGNKCAQGISLNNEGQRAAAHFP